MAAERRRRQLRLVLLAGGLGLLAAAASAWVAGGWSLELPGGTVRLHRPARTAVAAIILVAAWAAFARKAWQEDVRAVVASPWKAPAGLAAVLAGLVVVTGLGYGTFAASGADPSGYLSEAALMLEGRLRIPQDLADAPWPEPLWTLSPLGYRPATVPGAIVPTYPPGLPALFAAARGAFGACAPFFVVPLFGALLTWLTWRLGARLLPPPLAFAGSLLLAVSPPFLFQLMWPMSDVPVAALWLAALLLVEGRVSRPVAAGAVASLAILVRPNLAPLAAVCLGGLVLRQRAAEGETAPTPLAPADGRAARSGTVSGPVLKFAVGLAPGVLLLAVVNRHLYGAWWRLGYSSTDEFYSLVNVLPNLHRYGSWMIEANTPALLLALVPLMFWGRVLGERRWRFLLTGLVAVVWLSYLPYFQFDDWWYLRFLLPAWPALAVLTVAALHGLIARLLPGPRAVALALAAVLVLAGVTFARARTLGAFELRRAEQRYVEAARHVALHTPPGSVVLSLQHSGSVAFYSGRTPLRYDLLEPEWLDRAVAFLAARGRSPFILLDDAEVPAFRARFAGTRSGLLDWNPVAEWRNGRVLLFDAANRASDKSPVRIGPAPFTCRGK